MIGRGRHTMYVAEFDFPLVVTTLNGGIETSLAFSETR